MINLVSHPLSILTKRLVPVLTSVAVVAAAVGEAAKDEECRPDHQR